MCNGISRKERRNRTANADRALSQFRIILPCLASSIVVLTRDAKASRQFPRALLHNNYNPATGDEDRRKGEQGQQRRVQPLRCDARNIPICPVNRRHFQALAGAAGPQAGPLVPNINFARRRCSDNKETRAKKRIISRRCDDCRQQTDRSIGIREKGTKADTARDPAPEQNCQHSREPNDVTFPIACFSSPKVKRYTGAIL